MSRSNEAGTLRAVPGPVGEHLETSVQPSNLETVGYVMYSPRFICRVGERNQIDPIDFCVFPLTTKHPLTLAGYFYDR